MWEFACHGDGACGRLEGPDVGDQQQFVQAQAAKQQQEKEKAQQQLRKQLTEDQLQPVAP